LICGGPGFSVITIDLPFLDHVRGLNPGYENASAAKHFESKHRSNDAFNSPLILLDNAVQILALAQFDVGAMMAL
jgi:hypothetical protein